MPFPFLIPAIVAGAQTAFGIGQQIAGGVQRRKAQKFFDKNKYEVPSGVRSMLDVVRGVASQHEMPGSPELRQRQQSITSQGVETARRTGQSTSDVLGSLQGLYSKQMNAQQDLAIQNAQNWQKNQMQYANALNTLGQYETEKWNYNVLYPYMQKMTGAGQTAQAGNENIASGISSGLNIWSANNQMQSDEANYAKWKEQRNWNQPANQMPTSIPRPTPQVEMPNINSYWDYKMQNPSDKYDTPLNYR